MKYKFSVLSYNLNLRSRYRCLSLFGSMLLRLPKIYLSYCWQRSRSPRESRSQHWFVARRCLPGKGVQRSACGAPVMFSIISTLPHLFQLPKKLLQDSISNIRIERVYSSCTPRCSYGTGSLPAKRVLQLTSPTVTKPASLAT